MLHVRYVILFNYILHLNIVHQLYFTPSNAEPWTLAIGAMNLGDLYYRAMCYLLQYPALVLKQLSCHFSYIQVWSKTSSYNIILAQTSASPHKLPHGYKLPNAYMSHQAPHGGTHSTRLTQTNMNLIEYVCVHSSITQHLCHFATTWGACGHLYIVF